MRIFRTKWFDRFARRERIEDDALREAVSRAEKGLIDADLGGGVIKQRVARPGQGRSSGYRTIVLLQTGSRAVFAYGFAKNDRDNIRPDELAALRALAEELLTYDATALQRALKERALTEVKDDGDDT